MMTKYHVTFHDGTQATMLDPSGNGIDEARQSVVARFGASRVKDITAGERDLKPPEPGESNDER